MAHLAESNAASACKAKDLRGHMRARIGERFVPDAERVEEATYQLFRYDACDKQGSSGQLTVPRALRGRMIIPCPSHMVIKKFWIRGYVHEGGYWLRGRGSLPAMSVPGTERRLWSSIRLITWH